MKAGNDSDRKDQGFFCFLTVNKSKEAGGSRFFEGIGVKAVAFQFASFHSSAV